MALLGINAHLLSGQAGYRRAGIHHYIANLLTHLPQTEGLRYVVFSRRRPEWGRADMEVATTRWPTEKRWARILWEQVAWPRAAADRGLDLLHSMAFVTPIWRSRPTVVTVYDLSFIHFPERFPFLQRFYLTTQTRRSCRQARRVVTISESGKEDVHRFFGVEREQIDVVFPGVDATFHPRPTAEVAAFRRQHGLPERFVLHVGTLQPRKNIPALIEAMARLRRPDLSLVLVGGKGWFYDEIFAQVERLGLEKQVRFAGYVPDEALPLWYNAASLLVFPSVYEGFGMPIIEAMACGTPVIAAATSAIPEAAGGAALLFSPQSVDALVSQMLAVLDNAEQAATMRQHGLEQASKFSWDRAGKAMVATYRRALGHSL